jgi:hypothetical protein
LRNDIADRIASSPCIGGIGTVFGSTDFGVFDRMNESAFVARDCTFGAVGSARPPPPHPAAREPTQRIVLIKRIGAKRMSAPFFRRA